MPGDQVGTTDQRDGATPDTGITQCGRQQYRVGCRYTNVRVFPGDRFGGLGPATIFCKHWWCGQRVQRVCFNVVRRVPRGATSARVFLGIAAVGCEIVVKTPRLSLRA